MDLLLYKVHTTQREFLHRRSIKIKNELSISKPTPG